MNGILLYIDPGTGSMLFTVLLGIVSTGVFFFQKLLIKIKYRLSAGKTDAADHDHMDYVIFSDNRRYWTTFKSICDEFERRQVQVHYWTASPDDPALEEDYEYVKCEFIGEGNKAFVRLNMMRADVCLSTTPGLEVYQWKRSPHVKWYVHVFHAISEGASYRMFGLAFYDAILTTNQMSERILRELEKKREENHKEIECVGIPYMDDMLKRLASEPEEEHEGTTILLAPSWGSSSILCRFGSKIIDALIDTGYNIVIRPHPQSMTADRDVIEPLMKAYPDSDKLQWNFDNDNFDILRRSDMMISDFSAVMLDYVFIFGKPLIYTDTSFDDAPYDAAWLDEPRWVFTILPTIGTLLTEESLSDLKTIIDNNMVSEEMKEGRLKAKKEAWGNIGGSARSTVEYMIRKYDELNEVDTGSSSVSKLA